MGRKIIIAMVIISFLFGIAGSSQKGTLNDLNMVTLMVLSQKEKDKLEMKLILSEKSKESEGNSFKYSAITAEGKNIAECVSMAENNTGKKVFFGHLKSVFFDISYLKKEGNTDAFADYAKRNSYINHYVTMFALDDKKNLLTEKIDEEDDGTTDFLNSVVKKYPLDGIYTLKFNQMANSDGCFCIPVLAVDEAISFKGVCIVKDGVYKDMMDTNTTKLFKILNGEADNIFFNVPEGGLHIDKCTSELKYEGENSYTFDIKLKCEVEAYRKSINVTENGEEDAEAALTEYFTKVLEEFARDVKYKYNADIIGIEDCMRINDNERYEHLKQNGVNILRYGDINVNVKLNIVKNELFK